LVHLYRHLNFAIARFGVQDLGYSKKGRIERRSILPLFIRLARNLSENRDFVQNREILKNKHSHMFDIGVYAYLRALFFWNSEEFGQVSADSGSAFSDSLLGMVA